MHATWHALEQNKHAKPRPSKKGCKLKEPNKNLNKSNPKLYAYIQVSLYIYYIYT